MSTGYRVIPRVFAISLALLLTAVFLPAASLAKTKVGKAEARLAAPAGMRIVKVSSNGVKVSWKGVVGAEGYQVKRTTKGSATRYAQIRATKRAAFLNTGLDKARLYSYKVRAWRTVDGKRAYGPYSDALTIRGAASNIRVDSLKLNKPSASLMPKGTLQLKATTAPKAATNKRLSWSSSNKAIATVSPGGKVTAKAAGNAVITAKTEDGSKLSATCRITVKKTKPAALNGRYKVELSGTLGSTKVNGNCYLDIDLLSGKLTVGAASMFVSEKGWAADAESSLSLYGSGRIAALSGSGNFAFESTRASEPRLSGSDLMDGGSIEVIGRLAGSDKLSLSITGSQGGGIDDIALSGIGSILAGPTPGVALPVPPPVIISLEGRYAGDVSGTTNSTSVTGNCYLGVKNINGTPTVTAVSLFASEKGWAANATAALSIYGDGSLAALSDSGHFSFTATPTNAAVLKAHGLTANGSVTVTGDIAADGTLKISLAGALDGANAIVAVAGSGARTSATPPTLSDLPIPPDITAAIAFSPDTLPNAVYSQPYTATLSVSGASGAVTFAVNPDMLPRGLSLGSDGVFFGNANEPTEINRTFNFMVTATDAAGRTASKAYSIKVTGI